MRTVLIFRELLLPVSETFIRAQAQAVKNFNVCFVGMYRAKPSLVLSNRSTTLAPSSNLFSKLRVALFRRLNFAPGFYRHLNAWRPSLIHAHFAPDGRAALQLAKNYNVPLVVTLHGYDVSRSQIDRMAYRELWQRTTLFLCVSDHIKREAAEQGFPSEKLLVHRIGIDCDEFCRRTPRDQVEPGRVIFVGRLVKKKGCEFLVEAMVQVQLAIPGAHLVIIGDGPLRSSLEQLSESRGVQSRFLGAADSDSIRQHMEAACVLCVPSVRADDGDTEGLGMVFLEAQALGLPVVSTRHGGIPEAVDDGQGGLLAAERDPIGLANHILSYLTSEALRRSAGDYGIDYVRRKYDLKSQTKHLEEIYDRIISSPL